MQFLDLYSGLVTPQLSSLEILGIFADTPEDRKRYARLLAERQLQLLKRISEFEADCLQAANELSNSSRKIDTEVNK